MTSPTLPSACRPATVWSAAAALACCLAAPIAAPAAPTVEDALKIAPRVKTVDVDRPSADAAQQCTIGQEKVDGASALVLRGPGGEILRVFADTNGNKVVDRWSFYRDGLEVYRDIDSNHDTKSDQCRWLNSAGGRWAAIDPNAGAIASWKQLSAEEATAEIVAALRDRDAAAFKLLLPSRADLEAAGFAGEQLAALAARAARAEQEFAKVAAAQKALGPTARWSNMLAPQAPGVIPAGSGGATRDVTAYDNVVALAETARTGGVPEATQVFVGSLVRCGDVWRPIDAPSVGTPSELADAGGFFAPRLGGPAPGAGPGQDETIKPLVAKLQAIEQQMPSANAAQRGELAAEQVAVLEQVLATCAEADRGFWTNQLVETLAAYVQEGLVPDGIGKLQQLAEKSEDERLTALVAFRLAQARYSQGMQKPGVDGEKLQAQWFKDLEAFVEQHPQAPEAAEALLQLAFRDEFEAREKAAVERYSAIARDFPGTPQARKAAGAVRRLESVGEPLTLAGAGLDGKQVSMAAFRGTPVVVHWWSTECEPCKVNLAQIRELQARYGRKLAVVGIALDGDKGRLGKFLQAKPIPWAQIHEPGGLDSRLAEEFGVLALPTMFLVDAEGNVTDRNVSITDLERKVEALLEKK